MFSSNHGNQKKVDNEYSILLREGSRGFQLVEVSVRGFFKLKEEHQKRHCHCVRKVNGLIDLK